MSPRTKAVVDCYSRFQAFMRDSGTEDLSALWVSRPPIDGHPNALGHRIIAETLRGPVAKALAQRLAGAPSVQGAKKR